MQRQLRWAVAVIMVALVSACSSAPPPGYVSSTEFGDRWPLTVDEGVLECTAHPSYGLSVVPKSVTFRTNDGAVYAVNGTAKGRSNRDIAAIQKTAALRTLDVEPPSRFSEEQRKIIFAASVGCEDDADKKSQAAFPNRGTTMRSRASVVPS